MQQLPGPLENYTQPTYNHAMKALFVELPPFERYREQYMDDATFRAFQVELIKNPEAGDVIAGTDGLRKVRHGDARRGKGKRGGLRIIYYWWLGGHQFWLFTLYDKDEMTDLSAKERQALAQMLQRETQARAR